MRSFLGPAVANILMFELETSVIPNLNDEVKLCKRFFQNTYCFAKLENIDKVSLAPNCFHKGIQFAAEIEKDHKIAFLSMLIIRKPGKIENAV